MRLFNQRIEELLIYPFFSYFYHHLLNYNVQSSPCKQFLRSDWKVDQWVIKFNITFSQLLSAAVYFQKVTFTGNLLVSALSRPSSMISAKRELHCCEWKALKTSCMTWFTTQTLTLNVGGFFGKINVFIDLHFDSKLFDLAHKSRFWFFLQNFLECAVNLKLFFTELL